jgi:hypothetical protein
VQLRSNQYRARESEGLQVMQIMMAELYVKKLDAQRRQRSADRRRH